MAIAVIIIQETSDGTANVTAQFDPPVEKDAATEHPDQLPVTHYVALGMLQHASEELGDGSESIRVTSSRDGG